MKAFPFSFLQMVEMSVFPWEIFFCDKVMLLNSKADIGTQQKLPKNMDEERLGKASRREVKPAVMVTRRYNWSNGGKSAHFRTSFPPRHSRCCTRLRALEKWWKYLCEGWKEDSLRGVQNLLSFAHPGTTRLIAMWSGCECQIVGFRKTVRCPPPPNSNSEVRAVDIKVSDAALQRLRDAISRAGHRLNSYNISTLEVILTKCFIQYILCRFFFMKNLQARP